MHNFCNFKYMQATITARGNGSDEGGGRFKYRAYLVGVITAYCTNMIRCPDEVNLGA